jgi:HEPN domain-containing protein
MRKEVEKWFDKALQDLNAAKFNFKGGLFDVAAFFAQQAVEKALKALYLERFGRIRKIHDLVVLGRELELPEEFIDSCKELTAAYIYVRYPEIPEEKDIEAASEGFIKTAEEVLEWIKKQLKD